MKDSTKIGEDTEEWVRNLLLAHNLVATCERIGYTNEQADLRYTLHNDPTMRSIQVKTNSKVSTHLIKQQRYPPDMLIVTCRQDRQVTWSLFAAQINTGGYHRGWYSAYQHSTVVSLVESLRLQLPHSTIYRFVAAPCTIKEQNMTLQLSRLCQLHNWSYNPAMTVTTFDGWFNGYRAQLKYSSAAHGNQGTYHVSLMAGIKPYNHTDFDLLIVMIGSCHDYIYIIPMHKLIEWRLVATNTERGKTTIYLQNPVVTSRSANRYHYYIQPDLPAKQLTKLQTCCTLCGQIATKRKLKRHQRSLHCHKYRY